MIRAVFARHVAKWGVTPDGVEIETHSSWLLPVRQSATPAMLKVYKPDSDERPGTDYLRYLDGDGAVRVLEADDDALLMERATGVRSLFDMAVNGDDLGAAEILARIVTKLHAPRTRPVPLTLVSLDRQFASLFKREDEDPLLRLSAAVARALLRTPRHVIPLHGDLHHSNVLNGNARGWLAVDPKGLLGERTYEVANLLGNPWPHGEIVHSSERMRRMAALYAARLDMDAPRILAFALAHAGLAASWDRDEDSDPGYRLKCAEVLAPLVDVPSLMV
jgi:streptomycin 6-kinase